MSFDSDLSDILHAIHKRRDVARALSTGAHTQTEVSRRLAISRPTVSRAISQFEEYGIAERAEGGYVLTAFGAQLVDRDRAYVDDVRSLCQRAAIRERSGGSLSFDASLFENAETFFSRPNAPDSACYAHADVIRSAKEVRSVLGGIFTVFLTEHLERVRRHDQQVTLLLSPDTTASVETAYPDLLAEISSYDDFRLCRTDRDVRLTVTYARTATNEYAILLVHNDGAVVSSLRNDHPDAVEWARSWIDDYETDATEYAFEPP